MITRTYITL